MTADEVATAESALAGDTSTQLAYVATRAYQRTCILAENLEAHLHKFQWLKSVRRAHTSLGLNDNSDYWGICC